MKADINTYLTLHAALVTEKAQIEARLKEIQQALNQSGPTPAAAPIATTATPSRMKRVFSAATKRKMAASQKARWAAKKTVATPEAQPKAAPKPTKRKYSAEAKARMAAGAKARWAKARAAAKAKSDK